MPELRLHNTFTGAKEVFTPRDRERVTMYVCGPTVYNYVHIGNARPVVVFDCLYRLLSALYPQVVYARNITDIDDKIIDAALPRGTNITEVSTEVTQKYREDMASLNALAPTIEPMATEHIEDMIALTARLIADGHAYEADGHVLFAVESMPTYGELSGRKLEDMMAGARLLQQGWKLAYCADACVQHSHNYSLSAEFKRYFDIGVFHHQEQWLLAWLGKAEGEGKRFVLSELRYLWRHAPWRLPEAAIRTLLKYAGYRLGKAEARLPLALKRRLSMHRGYWG